MIYFLYIFLLYGWFIFTYLFNITSLFRVLVIHFFI